MVDNLRIGRVALTVASSLFVIPLAFAAPPTVGDKAPDFTLSTPAGKQIHLADIAGKSPLALVVLRGYPGYQCPYCNRQVQDFIRNAQAFADRGVHVVMVYPGPAKDLGTRANEFMADKEMPSSFDLVLDPDYQFTNTYGLRWGAPKETAYPSTFLLDSQGVIFFSKIVKEHGGRTTAAEILEAIPKGKT